MYDNFKLSFYFQGYGFRITYNGPNTTYQVVELRRNTEYKFRVSVTFFIFNCYILNLLLHKTIEKGEFNLLVKWKFLGSFGKIQKDLLCLFTFNKLIKGVWDNDLLLSESSKSKRLLLLHCTTNSNSKDNKL